MGKNEHERLSTVTLRIRHKWMWSNSDSIAILLFIVTVGSSMMSIPHFLK